MKLTLYILLGLTCIAHAQTAAVTKNPTTGEVNGDVVVAQSNLLDVRGNFRIDNQFPKFIGTDSTELWAGSVSQLALVTTDGSLHGLISRTGPSAGVPLIGISESGAAAGKLIQRGQFGSAVLYVTRDYDSYANGGYEPLLVVSSPADGDGTHIAEFRRNRSETVLRVSSDGSVTAPLQQFYDSNSLITLSKANADFANATSDTSTSSSQSLTSGVLKNITGIPMTLTAGVWDIRGRVEIVSSAPANMNGGVEFGVSTSATSFDNSWNTNAHNSTWTTGTLRDETITRRLTVATTDTVYLNVRATFSSATVSARGSLHAVRLSK